MAKALLIDLDGTLVDSVPALYQVYQKFLARYGHQGNRSEFESLIGPSIDEIVAQLKKNYKLAPSIQELANMYVTLVMMQGFEGAEIFPGAVQVLETCKNKKIKLALVTSGTKALVNACLKPHKVVELFDLIVTSEDVVNSKPHAEIYEFALNKLGLKASECIAIEDSTAGVESAYGAGLSVVYFDHGQPSSSLNGKVVQSISSWQKIGDWLSKK